MLPFLQPKKLASVMIASRKPSGDVEAQHKEDEMDPALMSASEDLIQAVHAKDATGVAKAIKAGFEICGSCESSEMSENAE